MQWLLLMINVFADTGGRIALKQAASLERVAEASILGRWMRPVPAWWITLGVILFAVEFLAWLALLSIVPLSHAVLLASLNIVAVAIAGRVAFKERLTAWRIAGIVLVCAGVATVGFFEK